MSKVSFQHWQQAKEIFEGALERSGLERLEFLRQACGDDTVLREEVESLLRSYSEAGSFMESPAVAPVAESLLEDHQQLEAGDRLNHYEVLEPLGRGGMGEVYLARDVNLGRRVAIKLLPEYVSRDPDRLRRFKHEARLASTLSHPNVCVIHEIGETDDGHPFIAMELIEGVTLREHLKEQPLELDQALAIGLQIADALNAAHEAGIVHRDIKPENIMIRRDGYVKVLDFGLAKLTEAPQRGLNQTKSTLLLHSTPGTVMGTAAYMSPEQARGVTVDKRTDVWSLGVVLYEMLCGRPPFVGETPTDVVVAIVDRDPPTISELVADVPAELERIVRKSLRKDPELRYQFVKEMAVDIRSLQRDLDIHRSLPPALSTDIDRTTTGARKIPFATKQLEAARQTKVNQAIGKASKYYRSWLVGGLLAVLIAGAFASYKILRKPEASNPPRIQFQRINVTKLTTNGSALFASISPDGKYVGYIKSEGGKESLWLRQVGNAGNLEIIPPKDGHYQGLGFSPDGNYIYYGYGVDSNFADIFKVPTLGVGAAAMKINPEEGPASVSHDGKQIAFVRYDREHEADMLKIARADGSGAQIVATRKWPDRFAWNWAITPAWTKDDQRLNLPVINSDAQGFFVSLFELNLADHKERIIPLSSQHFEQPSDVSLLKDGSGVIVAAKAQGASFSQVWILGLDRTARPLTSDLSDYRAAVLTDDSNSIVTVQTQTLGNIWTAPKGETSRATQITPGLGRYYDLSWAPDNKIVYASDASGNADIYEVNPNGSGMRQLTSGMKRNYAPTVSPDNRFIAFHSNRSGIFQVWRMDRDGGNPVQLTVGTTESNWPQFTPDGKFIFYEHFEAGRPGTIWKIPVEGGTPERVIEGFSLRPTVSPDGKWLGFWQNKGNEKSRWQLALMPLDGSKQIKAIDVPASVIIQWDTMLHWSADSRSLTYIDRHAGVDNIWAQPVDGGPARRLTNFADSNIFSFDWSRDGNLVASRGVITADVVLISDADKH